MQRTKHRVIPAFWLLHRLSSCIKSTVRISYVACFALYENQAYDPNSTTSICCIDLLNNKLYNTSTCRDAVQGGPKKWHSFLYTSQLHQILTDFQNSFAVKIRRQFVIKLSLQIPPHLKCVATLPREISDDALKPATPLTGCVMNVDRAWHVAPKQPRLKFS